MAIPQHPARIVLIGFMGAGKSTVGPLLARRMGWQFLDADHVLEQKTELSISEIFARHGEPRFRQMEAEVLTGLCEEHRIVIALGGGAIETEGVRSLLAKSSDTCVIFLEAPLDLLVARCEQQPDAAVRPVLRDRDTLRHRFASRLPHYRSAHITVATDGLAPEAVADRIYLMVAGDSMQEMQIHKESPL